MRKAYDVLAVFIVGLIALLVAGIAHAEPSEAVLKTIAMESSNQSLEGQAWVARVIQVRAKRANISEEAVVYAYKQFSCWNSRKWADAWLSVHYTPKVRQNAYNAYKKAIRMTVNPTHYHTLKVKPYWSKGKRPLAVIGAHAFYDNIK